MEDNSSATSRWAICEAKKIMALENWSDKTELKRPVGKYNETTNLLHETSDETERKHEDNMVTIKDDDMKTRHAKRRAMQYQDELVRNEGRARPRLSSRTTILGALPTRSGVGLLNV